MAKAFGKIILAGEHAVVYGHPAIACTLQCEVRVTASQSDVPGLNFVSPKIDPSGKSSELFSQVIPRLKMLLGDRVGSLEFKIESDVPGGCGLGSSAALSVALIRSILDYFHESRSASEIAKMALELEKIFHGNPSGVDHTVIAQEGLIWFEKGHSERIIAKTPLNMVVAIASPHAGTLKAVQAVRRRYEEAPLETRAVFEQIAGLTRDMRVAIEQGDLISVGRLMDLNQRCLKTLGVSTPELDMLCVLAKEHGALGAKLTGAGGGGCVIALAPEPQNVVRGFEQAGYTAFEDS